MKSLIALIMISMSSAAFAGVTANVSNFCAGSADEIENAFVINYAVDQAELVDVTRVLNLLGHKGHLLDLQLKIAGESAYRSSSLSLETQLAAQPKHENLRVTYKPLAGMPEESTTQKKQQIQKILSEISNYKGFKIYCDQRLSGPN
jgi:hypothetical protein